MREHIRIILLAGLMTIMVFAFAGCGSSNSGEKSTTESTKAETTEATETTTAPGDYDIMDGFQLKEDGSQLLLYGNDFMLVMPNNDKWGYEQVSETALEIYLKAARDDQIDGHLVTIMAFDPDDTSYEDFPSYSIAGHGQNSGKTFIALFPTDVQFNHEDAQQEADYHELYEHVHKIAEGMADSPFYTSDNE